jgi:hypothetical protein
MFLYSSVAGAAVSAAGAAVSVATTSAVAGLQFQLHLFLCQNLYQKVLQLAAVTKDKILSIDLEASSFDGITYSTSRGSELVSTIAKLECLILSFFYCDVFRFDIYYK